MCGLIACFARSDRHSFTRAREALASLNHRGPDELSYFEEGPIVLGHNRLSIVDIHHGQQPFFSSDGQIKAIINGEIYNAPALRQILAKEGYYCKSLADGEVIVGLYQCFGRAFISQLDGEFAFVIWDQHKQQMMVGRDRMGVKPLYYTELDNNIYFASEIKAFKALGIPLRWNANYVQLNHYGIYHPDETCFAGVYALAPGHYLCTDHQRKTIHAYYEMNFGDILSYHSSDSDYLGRFESLFKEAVKKRLQADVPIACYLSGGVDSTSVLAIANQLSNNPLEAFTIAFVDNPYFNEHHLAKASADYLGSKLHCLSVRDQDIADHFQAMVWHGETLAINAHSVAMKLLNQQIHTEGYKVVLGGHGADEFLGGYAFYQRDIEHYLPEYASLLGGVQKNKAGLIGAGVVDSGYDNIIVVPKGMAEYQTSLLSIYLSRQNQFQSITHADQMDSQHQHLQAFFHRYGNPKNNAIHQSTQLFTKATLQGYILSMVSDRMEMAHAVEGRVPFLDNSLCDFTMNLPLHLKINQGREKFILREALRDKLPPWIYQGKKQPFAAPPANQAMYALMKSVFDSDLLRHSPFYKQEAVFSLLESCKTQEHREQVITDSILLNVLSSCLLQEAFDLI